MLPAMACLEATVHGRVQGVGFRAFVRSRALGLGLSGSVANQQDGSVRLVATGPRSALEQLLERLREGPAAARIDSVESRWRDDVPSQSGFVITG